MNDLTKYNMRVFTIIGLLSVSLLFSCQSFRKKKLIKTIELYEKTFNETPVIDLNKGKQLIESYVTYSKQFPQDSLAAVYLCKANEIEMNLKKELIRIIELLENTLYASQEIDQNKGIQLIESYCNFSQQFPDDTLSAHYLYKAGEIAMNFKLGNQSITCFDKIINNYPTFSKVSECLFLKAFILDDQLKDYENARKIYNEFIAKYPNHPLAKDAKASLEYLGKSPEELVKMFQEKNKAN